MAGGVLITATSTPPVTFGEHVRRHRVEAGRSMGALARHLGLSVVAISDVERGRAVLRSETVEKIAAFLGADPGPLLALAKVARETWTPPQPVRGLQCGPEQIREDGGGES